MQTGTVNGVNEAILIKDIDKAKGRVQGYFAVFGNVDSDGDMIMPGAFKRSIQNNGDRIKHLWQHDSTKPLAKPTVSEDSYGLLFDSTISKTSWGRDALQLYADGVIFEHSIGYNVLQSDQKNGYTELKELKLWEGSSVTWAANERALLTGIKSLSPESLAEKMSCVEKAMRNGRYENEEIFNSLDLCYKSMQNIAGKIGLAKTTWKKNYNDNLSNEDVKSIMQAIDNCKIKSAIAIQNFKMSL